MSKLHANLVLLFAAALWGFGNIPQRLFSTISTR